MGERQERVVVESLLEVRNGVVVLPPVPKPGDPAADERLHIAVFPFEVGFTGFGYWPWVVGAVLLIQLQYLLMSGRIAKWRASRRISTPDLHVVKGGIDDA